MEKARLLVKRKPQGLMRICQKLVFELVHARFTSTDKTKWPLGHGWDPLVSAALMKILCLCGACAAKISIASKRLFVNPV
jgi:hypothetical protein